MPGAEAGGEGMTSTSREGRSCCRLGQRREDALSMTYQRDVSLSDAQSLTLRVTIEARLSLHLRSAMKAGLSLEQRVNPLRCGISKATSSCLTSRVVE